MQMYNTEVMYRSEPPVGDALVALADPTRRAMVELLAERPRRVGELVAAFPVSQPAISRHLRVLRQYGLIDEQVPAGDRRGRVYRLRPESLDPLAGWLDQVRRFWADHLEQFRSYAEGFPPHDPPKATMEEL
jgi:DNA-binding transcriptional ArsR family regulator